MKAYIGSKLREKRGTVVAISNKRGYIEFAL